MQNIKPLTLSTLVAVVLHIAVALLLQPTVPIPSTNLPLPAKTLDIQLVDKRDKANVKTQPLTKNTPANKTQKRNIKEPQAHKAGGVQPPMPPASIINLHQMTKQYIQSLPADMPTYDTSDINLRTTETDATIFHPKLKTAFNNALIKRHKSHVTNKMAHSKAFYSVHNGNRETIVYDDRCYTLETTRSDIPMSLPKKCGWVQSDAERMIKQLNNNLKR